MQAISTIKGSIPENKINEQDALPKALEAIIEKTQSVLKSKDPSCDKGTNLYSYRF
ncbi:MAG: hypothetical protein K940chlam5_01031 [Candidatus Anoxychlamydiales bacterium]|nr:hypothetical protein [Candidatus Anoxychlamydiales bacterium]